MFAAPSMQYTPGGYTLAGYCTLDPRSIAPVRNVTVHKKLPEILSASTLAGPIPLISEFAPIVIGAPFTVPIRWLFAPIVVAPTGTQITPETRAPLDKMTSVFAAW